MNFVNKIISSALGLVMRLIRGTLLKFLILSLLVAGLFGVVLNEKILEKEIIQDSKVVAKLSPEDQAVQKNLKSIVETQLNIKDKISNLALSVIWMGEGKQNYPLKVGSSFWVSGTCLNENSQLIKLFDDQVTIRNFSASDFRGLIRNSFQEVSCTKKGVNIRPVRSADLIKVNKMKAHLMTKLVNSIVLVTGICKELESEVLLEEAVVDVFSVQESVTGGAVLIGLNRSSKAQVRCLEGEFRYSQVDSKSARNLIESKGATKGSDRDYINISGVCKHEITDNKGNKKIKNLSLLNEPIQVMGIEGSIASPSTIKGLFVRGDLKAKEIICENNENNTLKMSWASTKEVLELINQ